MNLQFECCACTTATVGEGSSNTKTIDVVVDSKFVCPSELEKGIWTSNEQMNELFNILRGVLTLICEQKSHTAECKWRVSLEMLKLEASASLWRRVGIRPHILGYHMHTHIHARTHVGVSYVLLDFQEVTRR